MAEKVKVVQMGLGPIGNRVTEILAERSDIEIIGAIDSDPAKEGRDIGLLAGLAPQGIKVTSDVNQVLGAKDVDAVILTTTSSLAKTYDQLVKLLPYGVNVVSSCEELSYPWESNAELARKIDELAKEHNASVLGTGINPGFMMDFLPIVMTGLSRNVRKVVVERIQDASSRRLPFREKIGAGLTLRKFNERVKEGTLRHVGLSESVQMMAGSLGWKLDSTEDIISPIMAERQSQSQIETGTETETQAQAAESDKVLGVQQIGRGLVGGDAIITLVFRAAIGEPNARDRIVIDGTPAIDLVIKGGVNGDVGTCAILVNAIPAVVEARAGLRTMVNIVPPRCFQ
ncbi:hypothetical protein CEB3_c49000 [Peptococcaceae bacterium CEB3]|nr:hypothetical protein CEB3_c49000 [Peptococcaceae bacterium CEB3]